MQRRDFLKYGSGVFALLGLEEIAREIIQYSSSENSAFTIFSALRSDEPDSHYVISKQKFRRGHVEEAKLTGPLAWAPHSMFMCGAFLVGVPKEIRKLGIFDSSTLERMAEVLAPPGHFFYGHGIARPQENRFLVAAYRPALRLQAASSSTGFLLEYEIQSRGEAKLVRAIDVGNYKPHDFTFGPGGKLAYTLKNESGQASKIEIVDALTMRPLQSISVTRSAAGVDRRLCHLCPSPEGIFYSFNEVEPRARKLCGGGLGFVSWDDSAESKWESSYTSLFGDGSGRFVEDTLDVTMYGSSPVVSMPRANALCVFDVESKKFSLVSAPSISGARHVNGVDGILTTQRGGTVQLTSHGAIETWFQHPAGYREPVSHALVILAT